MLLFPGALRMVQVPMNCVVCHRALAHWDLSGRGEPPSMHCARCLLYQTPWGRDAAREIDEFVQRVNENRRAQGRPLMALDEQGWVVDPEAADVVVSSIYIGSRMAAMRGEGT